jgi:membrane protein YdbS with pleckstrin-like domain
MAGGVLAILIVPLLRLVAPTGAWVTIAAALLFAFGLLMPIAFAAAVWKYRVLDLDPEGPPAGRDLD